MVCVLLLPGRALRNVAGAVDPVPLEAPGTGVAREGEMCAEWARAGRTRCRNLGCRATEGVRDDRRVLCRTRPKAHLTTGISGERSESAACRG